MSMRARKIGIYLSIFLLGLPLTLVVFNDISILIEHFEIIAGLLLILSLMVTGGRLRRRLKKRMEQGLGRNVQDGELTSIATWMKVPDQAAQAGKEADRYDFDD